MNDRELNAEIARRFGWYCITWDNLRGRKPDGSLEDKLLPNFLGELAIPQEEAGN